MDQDTPDVQPIDAPEDEKVPFVYDEDAPNLVQEFSVHPDGVEALKAIADKCVLDFDEDWSSTEEYRQRVADDWALFSGKLPPKTGEFQDMANMHVPIVIENISRVYLRVVGELTQSDQIMQFVPVGTGEIAKSRATLLTNHMNWQIRRHPDWFRQLHRAVLSFFFTGDVTRHYYRNELTGVNECEVLQPDDFVVPYTHVSTKPDWSDVPHMTRIRHLYRSDLQSRRDTWFDVDRVLDGMRPSWDDTETPVADAMAEKQGITKPTDPGSKPPYSAPYEILQYEGYLVLPNQDHDRWCRVMIERKKKVILELTIHERDDWHDAQRHSRQMGELDDYWKSMDLAGAARDEKQRVRGELEQFVNHPDPMMAQDSMMKLQELDAQPDAPDPVAPMWMKDPADRMEQPAKIRKIPNRFFSHAVCIEPLVGNLGLGFGRIQADLTRAANTALNQHTDAATFSNVGCYLYSDAIEIPPKSYIQPGKFIKIQGSGQAIKDNLYPLQFGQASPQLMEAVKFCYEWGQSSMQSPAVLSGQAGKSGETAKGIMARIGQAMQQVSVTTKKFCKEDLEPGFKCMALLNSAFLPEEEMFAFNDKLKGQVVEQSVSRAMYEESYDVEITADLKFATLSQKIDETDELLKLPGVVPQLQPNPTNPMQGLAYAWKTSKKVLEVRGQFDLIDAIGPEPPNPTTPFGLMPPAPPMPGVPGAVPGGAGQPGVPTPKVGTEPKEHESPGGPPAPGGPPSSAGEAGGPPGGLP